VSRARAWGPLGTLLAPGCASAPARGPSPHLEMARIDLETTIHDDLVRACCAYWDLKDASYPKGQPARQGITFSSTPSRA